MYTKTTNGMRTALHITSSFSVFIGIVALLFFGPNILSEAGTIQDAAEISSSVYIPVQNNILSRNARPARTDTIIAQANNRGSKKTVEEEQLVNSFIVSKGYSDTIVFDASNIKQFWINNSVFSQNNCIMIRMNSTNTNNLESDLLKIQLANVNESQDCKIDVVTESEDVAFSVLNNKSRVLSVSKVEDDFIQYHFVSSQIHLEDTEDFSFYLKFNSKSNRDLLLKKIVLSFSNNKNSTFIEPPGIIHFTKDDLIFSSTPQTTNNTFILSGSSNRIFSKKRLFVHDNQFNLSVKIKNIGDKPTKIYLGYEAVDKNKRLLNERNYPYKNINNILNVISVGEDKMSLVVDSYPEWSKNSYLAYNVQEDLSDIPSFSLFEGRISNIKKLDNGHAEITLNAPIEKTIQKGAKVRVHGSSGSQLYTNIITLQPGEEELITSTIQKDNSFLQFSSKALSRGVYIIRPLLFSFSLNSADINMIQITNFTIEY